MAEGADGSGLGALGGLYVLLAGLRADRADVAAYATVLSEALGDALPPDLMTVEYARSLSDRVAGRRGDAVRLVVRGPQRHLELRRTGRGMTAQSVHVVRDVVISRREIALDEWLRELAQIVEELASRDARAATALRALLDP